MQTERVTFLTSAESKAALDAFAASSGRSVGHVLREASSNYLAREEAEDEEALAVLAHQVGEAVPRMQADIREAISAIERSNQAVDAVLGRGDSPA